MIKRLISIVAIYTLLALVILNSISIEETVYAKPMAIESQPIQIKVKEIDIYELKNAELLEKQTELSAIEDTKEWFIAYKQLMVDYSEWTDPPETIYDYFTEDEICLMQRCIETETYQCDFDSKVNVANTILNRVEHPEFPDKADDVVTAVNQFAYGRKEISEDTVLALEYAFMQPDTTNGALYFHSNKKTNTFNGATWLFTDNAGHHFYGETEE